MIGLSCFALAVLALPFGSKLREAGNAVLRHQLMDHSILLGEANLRRMLKILRSPDKDAPLSDTVKRAGRMRCRSVLGRLHHEMGPDLISDRLKGAGNSVELLEDCPINLNVIEQRHRRHLKEPVMEMPTPPSGDIPLRHLPVPAELATMHRDSNEVIRSRASFRL
jgi:hypothetical protein